MEKNARKKWTRQFEKKLKNAIIEGELDKLIEQSDQVHYEVREVSSDCSSHDGQSRNVLPCAPYSDQILTNVDEYVVPCGPKNDVAKISYIPPRMDEFCDTTPQALISSDMCSPASALTVENEIFLSNVITHCNEDFDPTDKRIADCEVNGSNSVFPDPSPHTVIDEDNYQTPVHNEDLISLRKTERQGLGTDLAVWAVNHNITHTAFDTLLKLLREHGHSNLPKSCKTLLNTPRSSVTIMKDMGQGKYVYYGVLNGMKSQFTVKYLENLKDSVITIDFFVDGISPYKSSRMSLWPIAGRLCGLQNSKPFVIALWGGPTKDPGSVHDFFTDFVKEAKELMTGFEFQGKWYKLTIRNCIADAPARAWAKQVNQHGSYVSCERCHIKGVWNGRMCYNPQTKATLRTDESFRNRVQPQYHTGTSPLEEIMGMVTQFPLDRLHLIDLGVMRRFISMLLVPKASLVKLNSAILKQLDGLILTISPFFPSEFARKPRSLFEWKKFKGTEYRRILHYDGFLLFKRLTEISSDYMDVYHLFLLLACAVRLLGDGDMCKHNIATADTLLNNFTEYSCKVFGPTFVAYNVHHLSHLGQDCLLHGPLDNFSAYVFESSLGHLKTMLRAPGRTLPQLYARLMEKESLFGALGDPPKATEITFHQPHCLGPLNGLQGDQYKKMKQSDFMCRVSSKLLMMYVS